MSRLEQLDIPNPKIGGIWNPTFPFINFFNYWKKEYLYSEKLNE